MRSITVEIAFTEKPNREKGSFIQTRKAVGVCTLHRPTPTAYPDYIYTHTNTPFSVCLLLCVRLYRQSSNSITEYSTSGPSPRNIHRRSPAAAVLSTPKALACRLLVRMAPGRMRPQALHARRPRYYRGPGLRGYILGTGPSG